ncbi:PepSY domain containing protein [Rhabdaerophilaceae bacterium]
MGNRFFLAVSVSMAMIAGFSQVSVAQGSHVCTIVPGHGWVSAEEVEGRLGRAGYRLLQLRVSNEACLVALVERSDGAKYQLLLHPATSEQLQPGRRVETPAAKP